MTQQNAHPPALNVSLSVLILPLIILLCGAFNLLGSATVDNMRLVFGLNPIMVRVGDPLGLFTYAFIQGSFIAALFNAAMLLAFGGSIMRAMGDGVTGFISFLAFFITCSVGAALAFCLLYPATNVQVIGASAAISGMVGAAIRMPGMWGNTAPVAPLLSRQVLGMSAFWVIYQGVFALLSLNNPVETVDMAWESHLTGYFLGLFLIEPWLRAFHGKYFEKSMV